MSSLKAFLMVNNKKREVYRSVGGHYGNLSISPSLSETHSLSVHVFAGLLGHEHSIECSHKQTHMHLLTGHSIIPVHSAFKE